MFGKLSAHQTEKMMRQMGINSKAMEVNEVIFRGRDKDIVIRNPSVQKIIIPGQPDNFQVIGEAEEVPHKLEGPSEDDIKLVAEKTGSSREDAKKALIESGDIAEAIIKLTGKLKK